MLISPDAQGIADAANSIQNGDLIAFPTDTFFAIGADGLNADAVDSVFKVKGRNSGTPVPLLVNDASMVEQLATDLPGPLAKLAEEFWPGALTIVLPASSTVPQVVTARTGTVGVRVPDNEAAVKLIEESGTPITGTSCNLTGRDPIKDAGSVEQFFNDRIYGVIDAPCGDSTAPSTVVSYDPASGGAVNVLRLGAISSKSLRKIVGDIVNG